MSGGYLFCADRSGAETEKTVTNHNILWTRAARIVKNYVENSTILPPQ